MTNGYQHHQAAHCETGAVSNLLRHRGLEISEPMVFGLSGGLTFAYIGFVKINGMPLVAYRVPPMMVLRGLQWRIKGLKFRFQKFRSETAGMTAMDESIQSLGAVGLQTSVFFLPYFPKEMRFHFNAHNIVAFGKDEDRYQISDPIFSDLVDADYESLAQARFSRGALAPKGMMYFPVQVPESIQFEKVIPKAIRFTCRLNGRKNFMPFAGTTGMKTVAKKIEKLDREDDRFARLFLGHMFRMQEEIGTGGAGFRFMYATFLQEAAEKLNSQLLQDCSKQMTSVGDQWREFALLAARMSQSRGEQSFGDIAAKLRQVAEMEADVYDQLKQIK